MQRNNCVFLGRSHSAVTSDRRVTVLCIFTSRNHTRRRRSHRRRLHSLHQCQPVVIGRLDRNGGKESSPPPGNQVQEPQRLLLPQRTPPLPSPPPQTCVNDWRKYFIDNKSHHQWTKARFAYIRSNLWSSLEKKTLPKAQRTQGIEYFDPFNTFSSKQRSFINLRNLGQTSAWFCLATLTNPCSNFDKSI